MRFTPSNSGQRSPPTYYRGCWHVVSRGFFLGYRPFSSPLKAVYDPKTFILHAALLGQGCPIAENSSLLPPVGVWAVLNPSVADRPLRPATDRRLGELLPHQPANRTQAHLPASCDFASLARTVCGIVGDFSPVFLTPGQIPTCSSPFRHSLSYPRAFDLHVLGTPPALILSQDQTLV